MTAWIVELLDSFDKEWSSDFTLRKTFALVAEYRECMGWQPMSRVTVQADGAWADVGCVEGGAAAVSSRSHFTRSASPQSPSRS